MLKNKDINSAEFKHQRKLYTFAPLGFIPVIAFLFSILGGGSETVEKNTVTTKSGFDASLPEAKPTEIKGKEEAYESADLEAEELKSNSSIKNDFDITTMNEQGSGSTSNPENKIVANPQQPNATKDVDNLYQKYSNYYATPGTNNSNSNERYTGGSSSGYSPRAKKDIKTASKQNLVNDQTEITAEEDPPAKTSLFFDSKGSIKRSTSVPISTVTFRAVIHGEQAAGSSSIVKLRTIEAVLINGSLIASNSFIYGTVIIRQDDRVSILIKSIKIGTEIIATNLSVYDIGDGQEGIFISGGGLRSSIDDATDKASSSVSSIPVVGQVADATINLLKTKRGNKKVILGSNYKILIKSSNN